jgi:acylphosphatase|tara:strand:- start:339 stop:644 length:306 start_codon:yes stop_codon:yes gene_type:complete
MNNNSIKIAHIYITGRVQGVSYRWWFQNEGEKKELKGWVRNRTSNRVEAEILGIEKNVNEMIKKCKEGPPLAEVDDVIVNYVDKFSEVKNNVKGIKILETI